MPTSFLAPRPGDSEPFTGRLRGGLASSRSRRFLNVLGRGLLAGLAGTLALSAFELFEKRLLGRDPLYAPRRIAARLAERLGARLGPRSAGRLGWLMRIGYGSSLGVAGAWLDPAGGSSSRRALRHGLALSAFELLVMPWVGAVPPLEAWPSAELFLLVGHATAFAAGAELTASLPGGRALA